MKTDPSPRIATIGFPPDQVRLLELHCEDLGVRCRIQSFDTSIQAIHEWASGRDQGHHSNIIDTPDRLAWTMRQVNSPWIRVIYDYSHFEVAGFKLGETIDLLLPFTKIISLKDSNRNPKDYRRLLPGDGQIDYVDYFQRLKASKYNGAVVVEVSGQIHSREGYDPISTTRYCYRNLLPYFKKAGINRRERKGRQARG